jgi:preprotein translocase subunit SecD
MILTNSKYLALLLLLCVGGAGCKTFSRLTNKGGTVYTVEIQTDEPNKEEIIERAVKVIQNKINAVGLDGEVSRLPDNPNQISVKLYGANDAERIKKFLFTTYRLELKKAVTLTSFPQQYPTREAAEKVATKEQEVLPYSEIDESRPPQYIVVEKQAVINGEDIRDASAYSPTGGAVDYQITFSLKRESAVKFGDWTGKNIGQYLAIVLDKKVLSVPVIKGQIFDQGTIEGRFTKASAEDIALSLRSGYLPATMKVLEEKPFN